MTSLATTAAFSGNVSSSELSADQVLQKVQERYQAAVTYSDEGQIVTTRSSGTNLTPFNIRLARPNFYRIEWVRKDPQGVWFAGAGNYLKGEGGLQSLSYQEDALAMAGGAAATVPMIFFNTHAPGGDPPLAAFASTADNQTGGKLGALDCYVITENEQGFTRTLWIDKQYFLVRQIQTKTRGETKISVGMEPEIDMAFTSTETHTNIILNQRFSRADFIPSFTTGAIFDN